MRVLRVITDFLTALTKFHFISEVARSSFQHLYFDGSL